MARNGSGTYSAPNSFSSGTTISSSAVNANFSDVGSEITNSLPRDGQAAMTGQLKASSGTVAAPGIAFSSDTDTGFYRKATGTIGIVADGTEVGTLSSSGLTDANSIVVTGMPTGCMMMYGATTSPTGWVRCNGRTVGNASSGATELASTTTENLFSFLWTNYADSVCAVSSGRGASAAADYAANKTIGLPDLRGRAFFGLDDMGATAASRLGTIITSQTTNGSSGGTETHTLTSTDMPAHTHTGTTGSGTAHSHYVFRSISTNGGLLTNSRPASQGNFTSNDNYAIAGASSGADVALTADESAHTHTFTTSSTGSGAAHSNMPPAFLTTFIIKL